MNILITLALTFLASSLYVSSSELKHFKLEPTVEMNRAEIYLWTPSDDVKAVLVFCPGHNGIGKDFVANEEWQKYAKQNKIALCGLSFASPYSFTNQGKGYSYAQLGSGEILLNFLDKTFSKNEEKLPIYMYGYSAGARFTASFMAWKPHRILGWCASGVGTWPNLPDPKLKNTPYGIVACGEYDAVCYWSSLNYFQRGREHGRAWTWISLQKMGHGFSPNLDLLVKESLPLLLKNTQSRIEGDYYDLDTKKMLSQDQVNKFPEFAVWVIKDKSLANLWKKLHHP